MAGGKKVFYEVLVGQPYGENVESVSVLGQSCIAKGDPPIEVVLSADFKPGYELDHFLVSESNDRSAATSISGKSVTLKDRSLFVFAVAKPTRIPATGVTLGTASKVIRVDEEFDLTATVTPANTTDKVTWYSTGGRVKIIKTGTNPLKVKVVGTHAGIGKVYAKVGSQSASCLVRVFSLSLTGLSVDKGNPTVLGVSETNTATVTTKTLSGCTYSWRAEGDVSCVELTPNGSSCTLKAVDDRNQDENLITIIVQVQHQDVGTIELTGYVKVTKSRSKQLLIDEYIQNLKGEKSTMSMNPSFLATAGSATAAKSVGSMTVAKVAASLYSMTIAGAIVNVNIMSVLLGGTASGLDAVSTPLSLTTNAILGNMLKTKLGVQNVKVTNIPSSALFKDVVVGKSDKYVLRLSV